jgi:hypothetical protein
MNIKYYLYKYCENLVTSWLYLISPRLYHYTGSKLALGDFSWVYHQLKAKSWSHLIEHKCLLHECYECLVNPFCMVSFDVIISPRL